ncbi:class I SAM-dependent methyltransferase [Streptomyces halobius]|uniref:class I SAM-dependent methyltransferase n=1 Tax=Streptomyces halobius TaxID=2879846 RepID=UPI0038732C19
MQGDAQVYACEPDAFDVAISRFGVMFFADPVTAFANIGRTLRPGGRMTRVRDLGQGRRRRGRLPTGLRPRTPHDQPGRPGGSRPRP